MKMLKTVALCAIGAFTFATAQAEPPSEEGWSLISEDEERDIWVRDKDWMAGRPDSRSALVWAWFDTKQKRDISHVTILIEVNCLTEKYRFIKMLEFDKAGNSTDIGSTEWDFASPQTIIGGVVGLTCSAPEDDVPLY
jgi:hypothetical protein